MNCPDCGKPMDMISNIYVCRDCEMMNKTIEEESWFLGEDDDSSESDQSEG